MSACTKAVPVNGVKPRPHWHEIDPVPTGVADARCYSRGRLAELDPDVVPDLVGDVALVVSELVTNAFRAISDAAESPAKGLERVIHLGVQCRVGRWAHVYVQDPYPKVLPVRRQPSESDLSGRGLRLVEDYAWVWWVDRREHDKTVHAVLLYPDVVPTQHDLDQLAVSL